MSTLENLQPPSITTLDRQNLLAFILKKRQDRRERKEVKVKAKKKLTKPATSKLSADQANELLNALEGLLNDKTSGSKPE